MYWTHYRSNDVENQLSTVYQANGILHPANLQLERIATMFGIILSYYPGRSFVHFDEDKQPIIFIDERLSEAEQREDFFHELCHPLRHTGCQTRMPKLFKELQEIQAAQFQLFAAMPFFMIRQAFMESPDISFKALASLFRLSEALVHKRIEQIQARIRGLEWMLNLPKRQKPLHPDIAVEKGHVLEVIFELRRIQQLRRMKERGQAHG